MRIVLITSWATNTLDGSGTAVFFNSFLAGLRGRGFDVEIIAPEYDISDYVDVTLKRFLFNARLYADPRLQNADVIIGFDYDGYGLMPNHHAPYIVSAHAVYGDLVQFETEPIRTMVQAQAFFDRAAMECAAAVTIGSQYAKDRIVSLYSVPPDHVKVIPHGRIEPAWMPLVHAEPRTPNDHPVLLAVGKMYPRKRVDLLLRALPILRRRYPNIELRIVGNGLEWDRLHTLADELDVNANITWLSQIEDDTAFAREWRQADLFVHASMQETFGFVYVEAMLLGVPIVAARAGAAPEVIGDAGLLVEPDSPQAIADGVLSLLESPTHARELADRGTVRARAYTVDRMIDGYVDVIRGVIGK